MNSVIVYHFKNNRSFLRNFTYLIVDPVTSNAVLVDPAGDFNQIYAPIAATNVHITGIFLTHCHHDHVNLADMIANFHDAPVYASRADTCAYDFACTNLVPLDTEETIQCGSLSVQTLFTPGHTAGSCCYEMGGHLFTGDTLFVEGCGICTDQGASAEDLFHSLRKLVKRSSPDTKVYPGHSYGKPPGVSFDYLLENNIYLAIEKIEHFVAFRMRKNQSRVLDFQ